MENVIKSTTVFKTVKTKTLATICAVIAAVALPQALHLLGATFNAGSALGEIFLPMHLSIFFVGFLAGPTAGLIAGTLSPAVSFALTGMPSIFMLPFMVIELAMYGLVSGLLTKAKIPSIAKLLIAQVSGRAVRAVAITIGFYLLGTKIAPAVIWTSIVTGLPGLALQWIIIPVTMFFINKKAQYE